MPVMNGYEATKALVSMMKNNEIPEVPIIGCTAFNSKERIESCYEAGMKDVINKPLSKMKLERVFKSFFNL